MENQTDEIKELKKKLRERAKQATRFRKTIRDQTSQLVSVITDRNAAVESAEIWREYAYSEALQYQKRIRNLKLNIYEQFGCLSFFTLKH